MRGCRGVYEYGCMSSIWILSTHVLFFCYSYLCHFDCNFRLLQFHLSVGLSLVDHFVASAYYISCGVSGSVWGNFFCDPICWIAVNSIVKLITDITDITDISNNTYNKIACIINLYMKLICLMLELSAV